MRGAPDLAKDVQAYPTLIGPGAAIVRINRALLAAIAKRSADIKDCRAQSPEYAYWDSDVDAPLLGERYVSFLAHGNYSCGNNVNIVMEAMTFDLRTGERVNWKALLPASLQGPSAASLEPGEIASPELSAFFVKQSQASNPDPDCKDAFAEREMTFQLWPDAAAKGLAMEADNLRSTSIGACGGDVTMPLEMLRKIGAEPALIRDIETGKPWVNKGNP